MLSKLFTKTENLIRNYNSAIEADFGVLASLNPEDELKAEYKLNPSTSRYWLDDISESFEKEYSNLNLKGQYFPGCRFQVYIDTYHERLLTYINNNVDATEITFLKDELRQNITFVCLDYIPLKILEAIEHSLELQKHYLEEKIHTLGFKAIYDERYYSNPKDSFIVKFEKVSNNEKSNIEILESVKATEKIIYLHELGVLDFLKNKSPFNTDTNLLAEVLSKVLEERQTTIQSYLNPIYSPGVNQRNNPLNNPTTKNKIKTHLAGIGFI